MAGDWIKMRSNLHEDPRVVAMSFRLKVQPLHVVGMLFRLWSWADSQSRDGHALSVTTSFLDSLSGVTGFTDALRSVGWIEGEELNLSLPRFNEHNGQTAKTRALGRDRKERQRSKDVTAESRSERDQSVTREEKRREEKISEPQPPSEATPCKAERRPSSIEEVKAHFLELSLPESMAEHFWHHYEANGWVQGKNKPLKKWKSAVQTWKSNQFNKSTPTPRRPESNQTQEVIELRMI
jgi:hypothetical protein